MKMTWKKKKKSVKESKNKGTKRPFSLNPNLRFDDDTVAEPQGETIASNNKSPHEEDENRKNLAHEFEATGNKLAEEGKYREALGKWETAITLMPERAVLHEQKAQVLLELEESWSALKAATRAAELEPEWAEAWVTLGRAQLNYGEPDCAIHSFDKALAIKPDCVDAKDDRQSALHLVKRRKQLHTTDVFGSDRSTGEGAEDIDAALQDIINNLVQ